MDPAGFTEVSSQVLCCTLPVHDYSAINGPFPETTDRTTPKPEMSLYQTWKACRICKHSTPSCNVTSSLISTPIRKPLYLLCYHRVLCASSQSWKTIPTTIGTRAGKTEWNTSNLAPRPPASGKKSGSTSKIEMVPYRGKFHQLHAVPSASRLSLTSKVCRRRAATLPIFGLL
jgi:hypothetical protein